MSLASSYIMSEGPTKDDFANQLVRHWPIIVFFAGMLVTWGVFSNRISTLESQTLVLKAQVDKTETAMSEVKVGITRIETSLQFIKEKLDNGRY